MGKHTIAALVSLTTVGIMVGSYYFSSPDCVSGDCENGCGVQEQAGKFHYEGCFRNGRAHGVGVFTSKTNHYYKGEFDNGVKQGLGLYRYPDGTVYEGQWVNNKREGQGKIFDKDGRLAFEGEWKEDAPLVPRKAPAE